MSYHEFYPQEPVPTDDTNAKSGGWSCVGFIVALIIISIILQLPGIFSGAIIYAGSPASLLMIWGLLLAPVVIIVVAFRWIAGHRDGADVQ